MTLLVILQFLFVSLSGANANALRSNIPENDLCANADAVDRLPYNSGTRSLSHTSSDEFAVACNPPLSIEDEEEEAKGENLAVWRTADSYGVWYKIQGAHPGTGLIVEITGVWEDVDSEIMMTDATDDGGECPSMFTCVVDLAEASSIGIDNAIPARSYQWYAKENEIYYIYISRRNSNKSGYRLTVDMFDIRRTPPIDVESIVIY